jgi:hypothetical protein
MLIAILADVLSGSPWLGQPRIPTVDPLKSVPPVYFSPPLESGRIDLADRSGDGDRVPELLIMSPPVMHPSRMYPSASLPAHTDRVTSALWVSGLSTSVTVKPVIVIGVSSSGDGDGWHNRLGSSSTAAMREALGGGRASSTTVDNVIR